MATIHFLFVLIIVGLQSVTSVVKHVTVEDLDALKNEMKTLKNENQNLKMILNKMNETWTISEKKLQMELSTLKPNIVQLNDVTVKLRKSHTDLINTSSELTNRIHGVENMLENMNIKSFKNGTWGQIPEPPNNYHYSDNTIEEVKRIYLRAATTAETYVQRVAFCALVKENIHDVGFDQILPFDNVITDTHNSFHGKSGVFTAPRSGHYMFFVSMLCYPDKYFEYGIAKDGVFIVEGRCENQGNWGTSTTPIIFHVNQGDKVWVKIDANDHSSGYLIYQSFSQFGGFLL